MKTEKTKHPIRLILILAIIFITLTLLYARFIATTGLVIKEYPIKTTKLSADYDGLKIAHFTDLHYGSTINLKDLKKIVKEINNLSPDIVVFTGDLIEDGVILESDEIEKIKRTLNEIKPQIETLAVIGNHDYDHDYWNQIVPNTNWHILDNTYEYVYYNSKSPILFVGFDDLREGTPDYSNAFSYLNVDNEDHYTIVLAHEPDQIEEIKDYNFDLMLSGHSHLGQIRLPGIGALYTPVGSKKYCNDHYKVNDADLYISGGIGTSLLKMRLFNKPSINLYRFYTK